MTHLPYHLVIGRVTEARLQSEASQSRAQICYVQIALTRGSTMRVRVHALRRCEVNVDERANAL